MRDVENKPNKGIKAVLVFTITFFCALIFITQAARVLSPTVDVEIGMASESEEIENKDEEIKKMIDERLKWIEFEDNVTTRTVPDVEYQKTSSTKTIFKKDEEIANLPEKIKENDEEAEIRTEATPIKFIPKKEIVNPELPDPVAVNPSLAPTPIHIPTSELNKVSFKMNRVIVGDFETIEEAMKVQNRLINSDLNIIPYIKNVNGAFILQAGSFANKEKALALVSQIKALGYNSQVIAE